MTAALETGERIFHRTLKESWPVVSHGEGVYLVDTEGRRYLDACAGVHVISIGHGVREVADAMREQAGKVCFTYSQFLTEPQVELAGMIAAIAPGDLNRVFFTSGGSEATEAAMKMARKYHVETGNPGKFRVISRWQSWHGNTVGAMSMSGRSSWRADYGPYLMDFPHLPPPIPYRCDNCGECRDCLASSPDALERVILQEGAQNISAFIAEPILGTSAAGAAPPPDYFPRVREICDRYGILFIVDEVVTGFGRTGLNFGIEHWQGVVPDILTTGKGLSSGYTPIAATIATDEIYEAIYSRSRAFVHGHTYGGNPLSCATALAVQKYIEDHGLVRRCAEMGELMFELLKEGLDLPIAGEVRGGRGLLAGVELVRDKERRTPFDPAEGVTAAVVKATFDKGVLIMAGAPGIIDGVHGDHIAVSPPFTIEEAEVRRSVEAVLESIDEVGRQLGY